MTALESLIDKLGATELYTLTEDTRIYAELAAYAEVLQLVYDVLSELENECFIQTAEDFGLDAWCYICGIDRDNTDDDTCRERILLRTAVDVYDYKYDDIMFYVQSFGLDGSFTVDDAGRYTIFTSSETLTGVKKTGAEKVLKRIFPAETDVTIE